MQTSHKNRQTGQQTDRQADKQTRYELQPAGQETEEQATHAKWNGGRAEAREPAARNKTCPA